MPPRSKSLARLLSMLLLLLVPVTVLGACGSDDDSGATAADGTGASSTSEVDLADVTLRVGQVGKVLSPIVEYAEETDAPYKIEWSSFDAAPPIIQALQSDAIDVAIAGDIGVAGAVANGVDLRAVALTETPGVGMKVLVPKDSPLETVADLEGKKLAVFKGSSGEGFLVQALATADLTEDDLEIVDLDPASGGAAFNAKKVDAWAIWDPMASATVVGSDAKVLIDGSDFWKTRSFLVTTPKVLDDPERSAAIAEFVERFARSGAFLAANPDGWPAKFAEANDIPLEVAEQGAKGQAVEASPVDDEATTKLNESFALYREVGILEQDVDPADILDPRFTEQVKRGKSN